MDIPPGARLRRYRSGLRKPLRTTLRLELERFDWVNDLGEIVMDVPLEDAAGKVRHGCGNYTLRKHA